MRILLKIFLLVTAISLLPALTAAQSGYTNVTATVIDPNGTIYVNAPYTVTFFDPGTSGKLPLLSGSTFQKSYNGIATNGSGVLSITLPDNGVIASTSGATGTQWIFSICTANGTYTSVFCIPSTAITITGNSQDISSILTPIAPILPTYSGGGSNLLLQVNSINTASQSKLNLLNGNNVNIAADAFGNVTINSSGSGGGGGGLSFVSTLPANCTPGVTQSVQLSVSPYTINYCSAPNTWSAVSSGGSVLSIATSGCLTGGTITISGTISSGPTCALTTSPLSQFAPTTSAQLASVIVDGTGVGPNVFGISPNLINANLNTPSSINLTNATGFPILNQNTLGTASAWTTPRLLAGNSVNGTANVPFANKFIVQGTADAGLTGAQFLGNLSTGILKSTTVTGSLSVAASSDIISIFSGTCNSTTFLRGDGSCQTSSGGGNVSTSGFPAQFQVAMWASPTTILGTAPSSNGQCFMSAPTNFATSYPTFQNCPSGFANPMTTPGDLIIGGTSGVANRLAGPISPNGVPQTLIDIPTGGAANLEVFSLYGIPVNNNGETNCSGYTLNVLDRSTSIFCSGGTTSTITLPIHTTAGFGVNFPFVAVNNNSGNLTLAPTTDTIDNGTVLPGWVSFAYNNAAGNWQSVVMPQIAAFGATCANGLTWSTVTGFSCFNSNTFYAHTYAGATVDAKVIACLAAAIAVGGVCDARGITSTSNTVSQIAVGDSSHDPVTLILPVKGSWVGTMTDTTSCVIKQFPGSTIIGFNPGGSISGFSLNAGATSNLGYVYCTDPTTPPAGGSFMHAEGFAIQNSGVATANNIGARFIDLQDNSTFDRITVFDQFDTTATYVDTLCCSATFNNFTTNSNFTANAIPLQVNATGGIAQQSVIFNGLSADHPGATKSAIVVRDTTATHAEQVAFNNAYIEGNTSDTTKCFITIDGPRAVVLNNINFHSRVASSVAPGACITNTFATQLALTGMTFGVSSAPSTFTYPATAVTNANTSETILTDANGNLPLYNSGISYFSAETVSGHIIAPGLQTTGTPANALCTDSSGNVIADVGVNCFGGGGGGTINTIVSDSPLTGGGSTSTTHVGCTTCVTSASALTNKGVMIGGGGQASSTIDFPDSKSVPLAICVNGIATTGVTTTTTVGGSCRGGTNNKDAYIGPFTTSDTATFKIHLPKDWDSTTAPALDIDVSSTDATNGHTIILQAATECAKLDGSTTDDLAFNAAQSMSTVTLNGTANSPWAATLSALTTTGCSAPGIMWIKVTRTTDTATNVEMYEYNITIPRLLTMQAN